jgi:hypothetical protein
MKGGVGGVRKNLELTQAGTGGPSTEQRWPLGVVGALMGPHLALLRQGAIKGRSPCRRRSRGFERSEPPPNFGPFGERGDAATLLKLRASSFCQERKAPFPSLFFSLPSSPSLSPFFEWRRTRRG